MKRALRDLLTSILASEVAPTPNDEATDKVRSSRRVRRAPKKNEDFTDDEAEEEDEPLREEDKIYMVKV